MPKMWRVYSGSDGRSHIAEVPWAMQPFVDTEGAHGQTTPTQSVASIAFRVSPPGYVLNWHCAPRRQYSIALSGSAEIEVGDGTVANGGIVTVNHSAFSPGTVTTAARLADHHRAPD